MIRHTNPTLHYPHQSVAISNNKDIIKAHREALPRQRAVGVQALKTAFNEAIAGSSTDYLLRADPVIQQVRALLKLGSNAAPDGKLSAQRAGQLAERLRKERDRRFQEALNKETIDAELVQYGGKSYARVRLEDQLRIEADLLEELGYGHCAEQAAATYLQLKAQGIERVEIGALTGSDHLLVVLGRRPDSDPHDPSTWGEDTVLVDTWANTAYRLSELGCMQQPEKDIRYLVDSGTRPHYLAGQLWVKPSHVDVEVDARFE